MTIKNKIDIIRFFVVNFIVLFVLYTIITINIAFQTVYNKEINKSECTCDCWDGKFKGEYLYSTRQYKAVYFNMTWNTTFVLLWSIFHINLLINYLKYAFDLFFAKSLNYIMFAQSWLLFYGIYYNWWCTFNYINDDFWSMIFTQMFFNFTELINAYYIYIKINKKQKTLLNIDQILLTLSTALIHILIPLLSQGIFNISQLKGRYQRDLIFLLTDFLILIYTVKDYLELNDINYNHHIIKTIKFSSILLCSYFILDIIEINSW